ncbi:MAG: tetratricopeptide repeat protein [Cyclobacteriaceae bacterium]
MWLRLLSILLILCVYSAAISQKRGKEPREQVKLLIETSKLLCESTPDSALQLANKAFIIAKEHKLDSLIGRIYATISVCYSYQARYDSSIQKSFEALKHSEIFKDSLVQIDAYNNLGIDFMYQGNYKSSLKFFEEVEMLSRLLGDSLRLGHAFNNQGMVQSYLENYEEELSSYKRAKEVFQAIGEEEGYGNTLLNIGTVYTMEANYQKAQEHYEQALEVFEKLSYATAVEQTLQSMSENFLEWGRLTEAESHAMDALDICLKNDIGQDLLFIYELLANIYSKKGQFEKAFQYQSDLRIISDSLFNAEKSMQIRELEAKYETEKKQKQIEFLSIQNKLNELEIEKNNREKFAFTFAIILLMGVGGYVIHITVIRSQLKGELLSKEIDNLRLKINSLIEGNVEDLDIEMRELNGRLVHPLTDREFEIFATALSNKNNNEIAEELFVSVNTVKFHLKNIYEKLGVSNRKEALQFAVKSTS